MRTLIFIIIVFLTTYNIKSQCNIAVFTVDTVVSACPNEGEIIVKVPGGGPCSGWNAVLVYPNNSEVNKAIPSNGGPISYLSLDTGYYEVFLYNASNPTIRTPYSGNPVLVSTNYPPVGLSWTSQYPSCNNASSNYTEDGELTINVTGGIGPFKYQVIGSVTGTHLSAYTSNTSYTFNDMDGGEDYTITVYDDISCSNLSYTRTNLSFPANVGQTLGMRNHYFKRVCDGGSCDELSSYFDINGARTNSNQSANMLVDSNLLIRVNGGVWIPLIFMQNLPSSGMRVQGPNMQSGDTYEIYMFDSCDVFQQSYTVPVINDSWLNYSQTLTSNNCVNNYGLSISTNYGGAFRVSPFCDSNQVVVEFQNYIGNWDTVINSNLSIVSYDLDSAGTYRLTIMDSCHTVTDVFTTLSPTSPSVISVVEGGGVVEGTSSIMVRGISSASNSVRYPITVKVVPVPFVNSINMTATGPGNIVGNYTLNFPFISDTLYNLPGTLLFGLGDLPLGDYQVTIYDACGDSAVKPITLSQPAHYDIAYTVNPNCDSTSNIAIDITGANMAGQGRVTNSPYGSISLFKKDGTWVKNLSPVSYSTSTNNVPAGEYYVIHRGLAMASWGGWGGELAGNYFPAKDAIFFNDSMYPYMLTGVPFSDTGIRGVFPFYFPVTIEPYEDITINDHVVYCDSVYKTVFIEVNSGTPVYPLIYNLYTVNDSLNPVYTDTAYSNLDSNAYRQSFYNVDTGFYIVEVISGYNELTRPSGCVSVGQSVYVSQDYSFPKFIPKDSVVCKELDSIFVYFGASSAIWDVVWYKNDTNNIAIDSGVNYIQIPVDTAQYIIKYKLKDYVECSSSITLLDTFTLFVIYPPDTTKQVKGDTLCYGLNGEISLYNADSITTYEVFYMDSSSLTTILLDSSHQDGDTVKFIVGDSLLDIGINNFLIMARNGMCKDYLIDTVIIYVYDTVPPKFIANDTTIIITCYANLDSVILLDSAIVDSTGLMNIVTSVIITDSVCLNKQTRVATYIATNVCGLSDTLTQKVIVRDSIPPSITCMDVTVYLNSKGEISIDTSHLYGVATDNCLIDSVWMNNNDTLLTCNNLGTNLIEVYAVDLCGNLDTCTAMVTVIDTILPTIICQDATVFLGITGTVSIDESFVLDSLSDNCSLDSVWIKPSDKSFTCVNLGANKVTLYVMDGSGNIDSCISTVTVLDTITPILSCPNDTTLYQCIEFIDPLLTGNANVTDNCLDSVWYKDILIDNNCYDTLLRNWYATDISGNTDSCIQTIIFMDTFAPVFIGVLDTVELLFSDDMACLGSNLFSDNASQSSITNNGFYRRLRITHNYINNTTNTYANLKAYISHVWNLAPAAPYRGGCSTVSGGGQFPAYLDSSTLRFISPSSTYAGLDPTTPTSISYMEDSLQFPNTSNYNIVRVGNLSVINRVSNWYTQASIYTDSLFIIEFPLEGFVNPSQTTMSYSYRWNIEKNSGGTGNTSLTGQKVIPLLPKDTIVLCSQLAPLAATLYAEDDCSGAKTTYSELIKDSLSTSWYTIERKWTAIDSCGNTNIHIQNVYVHDTIKPIVSCRDTTLYIDVLGSAISIDTGYILTSVSDNCSLDSVWLSTTNTNFTCEDTGTHQVTIYAKDASGNIDSCIAVVTILDTILPTIMCNDTTVYLGDSGGFTINTSYVVSSVNDNCSIDSIWINATQMNFSCGDTGVQQVIIYAQDANGNIDSCSARVLVLDSITPTVVCQDVVIQLDANGQAVITAIDINNGSTDNCGIDTMYISQTNFDCSNIGVQDVTLYVMDLFGNMDSCIANVTVEDISSPLITCPSNIQDTITENCEYTIQDYTGFIIASDNCSDSLSSPITQSPVAGTILLLNGGTTSQSIQFTITDNNGNASICSFDIELYCMAQIIIPEFISPNGDGKNDVWEISNLELYPQTKVKIFNRWGALVYSKDNYDNSWDGKMNKGAASMSSGGKLPSGTYYYIVTLKDREDKPFTGFIHIH